MDYDDNDFQSQHFQLVGEDNLNFSTGICSFALPKFDLDDQLQLRFDNLGESDSLLGIRTHERNSWIDEFTAGSGVIEFTSSAAESCSIPRHNNVWSEATSTESVEMLLKAVGEDEMIDKTTITTDSVSVLDSTGNQMDTCPTRSDLEEVQIKYNDTGMEEMEGMACAEHHQSYMEEVVYAEASNVQFEHRQHNVEEVVCPEPSNIPIERRQHNIKELVCADHGQSYMEEVVVYTEPSNVQIECRQHDVEEMVYAEPSDVPIEHRQRNVEEMVCAEPSDVQIERHQHNVEEMVYPEASNVPIECRQHDVEGMVYPEPSDVPIECRQLYIEEMVCPERSNVPVESRQLYVEEIVSPEPSNIQIERRQSNVEELVCAEPSNIPIECLQLDVEEMVCSEPSNVQIELRHSNVEELVCAEPSNVQIECIGSNMKDMVCTVPSDVEIECHSNIKEMVFAEESNVPIERHNSNMETMVCAEPSNVQIECLHSNMNDMVCAVPSDVQIQCHSNLEKTICAEESNVQIECHNSSIETMVSAEPSNVQIECRDPKMEDMVSAEPSYDQIERGAPKTEDMVSAGPSNVQIENHENIPEESGVNAPDEATYQTQTVGMSADQNPVKEESLGVEMLIASHSSHGGNAPASPGKFFEDKEAYSEDKDNGEIEMVEKQQPHSHEHGSSSRDCSGVLARKDFNLSPSNKLMDLSVPTSIHDVASADQNNQTFDNQAGCSTEVGQTEKDVDPSDADKLAHGNSLLVSENLVDPDNNRTNTPVFMKDRKTELAVKESDGLLDVVVNQMKVFNAASQESPFEELEGVCSLEDYSQEKKEGNAGNSLSTADTTGRLDVVQYHEKTTELNNLGDEGPEKSVSMRKEMQGSDSLHDQDNISEKELQCSAAEAYCLDKRSNVTQSSEFEEIMKPESLNHVPTVTSEMISNESDNALNRSEENLDSSVCIERVEVESCVDKLNDSEHLSHLSAATSGTSDPHMGFSVQEEHARSSSDNTTVLPAGTGMSAIQAIGEIPVQVHNASPASPHKGSSDNEYIEEKNVLVSETTNMAAPEKLQDFDWSPSGNTDAVVVSDNKLTLQTAENTISDNPREESFEKTNFSGSPVQETCKNIQTTGLQQPLPDSQIMQGTLDEQPLSHDSANDVSCSQTDSAVDLSVVQAVPHTDDSSVMMETDDALELPPPSGNYLNEPKQAPGSEVLAHEHSQLPACSSEGVLKSSSLNAEVETPGPSEPNCSSPTVISCSRQPYGVVQDKPSNQKSFTSDELPLTSNVDIDSDKGKSADVNPPESNFSEDDRGFSFKIGGQLAELSENDSSSKWKMFPTSKSSEGTPASHQHDSNDPKGEIQENQQVSFENLAGSAKKSLRKEKNKLGSAAKLGSDGLASSRRKSTKESPISRKKTEKIGKLPGNASIVTSNKMQLEEMRQPFVQESNVKPSSEATVETPKLPDLNTASATALFSQPFTDAQQVQLRAQIFVYGSLIQGMPPDESIMISAFGDPDGGRTLWEGAWRAVAEKYYNQKSPLCETPARPVIKGVDFASRCSPLQSKAASTISSYRAGAKSSSPAIVASSISLPPPVWAIPSHDASSPANVSRVTQIDPSLIIPPMQPYLSPQVRHQTGAPAPWFTQSTSAPRTPTVSSSAHDVSLQHPTLPVGASMRFPQIRESAVPHGSNIPLTPSSFPSSAGHPNSLAVQSPQIDANKVLSSPSKHSEQKSRKRKKDADSDGVAQTISVSQSQSEQNLSIASSKPATITIPSNPSARSSSSCIVSTVSPVMSPKQFQIIDSGRSEHKVLLSEETCSKVEQAKLQAEDAAAFAASAVRHSESIWNQLALQRNAGLLSEVEQKLASSAAAAAAAVAVAKAAAAAAKVAADSALQAKLMADEAVISSKTGTDPQGLESGQHSVGKSLTTFTPAVSLGTDKANSSVISAAREGVRRRVEAASAAAKRAEILDAIVKAAELAAAAVAHAGAIVALPDPLPFSLSDILDAGPQNYWKSQPEPVTVDPPAKTSSLLEHEQPMSENAECLDQSASQIGQLPSNANEVPPNIEEENSLSSSKLNGQPAENHTENEKGGTESDHNENGIQEGSIVEVASIENGLGVVWYSARVLNIKDRQAYVCYNTLHTNEGSDKIKEWIPLKSDKESAPRIRTAHPFTTKNEGTRKRGRSAVTTYVWSVGDRVDAWLRDGWCEGVIVEKSDLDDTKLTVRFSAGGESSIVRSWDLRPSLVWVNGQWTEWTRSDDNLVKPTEGDTPREKRKKRRKADEKINSSIDVAEGVKIDIPISANLKANEECGSLALSAAEKLFSAGQVAREESNADKVKRTGLRKEGSKVIFGVPKPGRRRKFMDVSKHCVVDKAEKVSAGNDPVKSSKYSIPQTSHESKHGSKVGPRDKLASNQKVKPLKSAKSHLTHTRSAAIKESTSTSLLGSSRDGISSRGRFTAEKAVFIPEAKPVEDERQIHAMEPSIYEDDKNLSTDDNLEKSVPGSGEPRRSNRRIQPTSRLLEGLQSSMIISKIPSFSHDRGGRAIRRTGSSTRGRPHG